MQPWAKLRLNVKAVYHRSYIIEPWSRLLCASRIKFIERKKGAGRRKANLYSVAFSEVQHSAVEKKRNEREGRLPTTNRIKLATVVRSYCSGPVLSTNFPVNFVPWFVVWSFLVQCRM